MTKQQFIELAAAEQESLRRFLCGLCGGDGFRADDIAQEALLKAYLSFERFQGRSRFSTWLFRIAYNCWYDQLQNYPDNESVDLQEVRKVEDEGSTADKKYEYQQLYDAIGSLNRQEQAVILLFYMEEKSVKEIEVITGMPSGRPLSSLIV
jgi:RNA polymerase sigma-70 factor (ECF subfamily)